MTRLRTITLKHKNFIELLSMDNFTFEELNRLIKSIIRGIDYNPKNFIKLLEENKLLKDKIETLSKNESEVQDIPIRAEHIKRISKSKDGTYELEGNKYEKLYGTREEVWNNKAYKTNGLLKKSDLMINAKSQIVSKRKFIQEKNYKRFEKFGVNAAQCKVEQIP